MFKITIDSTAVTTKTGVSNKTGKPYIIREQGAYIFLVDREGKPARYPAVMQLTLKDQSAPYPVGDYILQASSFYMGRFGKLEIHPEIRPVAQAVKAAA